MLVLNEAKENFSIQEKLKKLKSQSQIFKETTTQIEELNETISKNFEFAEPGEFDGLQPKIDKVNEIIKQTSNEQKIYDEESLKKIKGFTKELREDLFVIIGTIQNRKKAQSYSDEINKKPVNLKEELQKKKKVLQEKSEHSHRLANEKATVVEVKKEKPPQNIPEQASFKSKQRQVRKPQKVNLTFKAMVEFRDNVIIDRELVKEIDDLLREWKWDARISRQAFYNVGAFLASRLPFEAFKKEFENLTDYIEVKYQEMD